MSPHGVWFCKFFVAFLSMRFFLFQSAVFLRTGESVGGIIFAPEEDMTPYKKKQSFYEIPQDKTKIFVYNGEKQKMRVPGRHPRPHKTPQGKEECIMFEKAKWITARNWDGKSAPVFVRTFRAAGGSDARLAVCGLGFYRLMVNGRAPDDRLLDPPFTAYDKRVLYQIHDISDCLTTGENRIEITLGRGWFCQEEADAWQFEHAAWKASPRMICQLMLDGENALVSDTSWQTANGPTVYNSLRVGEHYDAGVHPTDYTPAMVTQGPGGILKEQKMPPVRLCETRPGKEIGYCLYDFGCNLTGNAEITVCGRAGDEVVIQYAERIRSDGSLDRRDISHHTYTERFAEDRYYLGGDGIETWHGSFSFHGFRYARLYYPRTTELLSVVARGFHTDLRETGSYKTSDARLNRLHDAVVRSTLTNYIHIPTDCPHREKNGWTADAMLSSFQTLYNFDMTASYLKWLDDITDCQRPNGQIPCIVPTSLWGYGWGSGITWDSALFILPYNLYRFTGDLSILRRYYPAMRRYIAFLETQADDDIFRIGLGEWCAPEEAPECDDAAVLTCFAKHVFDLYGEIARLTGDRETAVYAQKRASEIRLSFGRRFAGKCPDSQTFHALQIAFSMTDDIKGETEALVRAVHLAGDHIMAGIFGAKYVPEVLRDQGHFDLAWKLITQDDYPGWFYMMRLCSGTLGEEWSGRASQNHHMFSAVDGFLHASLSGLRPDCADAGFTRFCLKPFFPAGLERFSAHYLLGGRKIGITWDADTYTVTLPEDMPAGAASVCLDGKETPLCGGENILSRR